MKDETKKKFRLTREMDREVLEALYKLCVGYWYDEVVYDYKPDKDGNETVTRKVTHKFQDPGVMAIKFYLENRDAKHWNKDITTLLGRTQVAGEPFDMPDILEEP